MAGESSQQKRSDRAGLAGYGCLVGLLAGGLGGGCLLVFMGIATLMRARTEDLGSTDEAWALVDSLEGAVALCGAGALALLIGIVSGVVLLKEMADETERHHRGPVR